MSGRQAQHPLARRGTIRALRIAGGVALALAVLAEPFVERHPYFEVDQAFGFHAWYGFGACVAMVLVAKLLGRILKRPEDYYGD